MNWKDYQEAVAEFFRSIGAAAETDATIVGVRGRHKADVLVRLTHFGIPVLWIIECKLWETSVPKEKILTLQQIVQDTGADRGFLMSESGFQAGAIRSASNSNITLSSLSELKDLASDQLLKLQLQKVSLKLEELTSRYHNFITWREFSKVKPYHLIDNMLPSLFDIRTEIFKAYNNTFPIYLMSGFVRDIEEFLSTCFTIFDVTEAAIADVEAEYNTNMTSGLLVLDELRQSIEQLIALTFEIIENDGNKEIQDVLRLNAVDVMKKVGELKLELRTYTTNSSYPYLQDLHHELIDGIYLDLTNEALTEDAFNETAYKLRKTISAFEGVFQPINSPPAPNIPS